MLTVSNLHAEQMTKSYNLHANDLITALLQFAEQSDLVFVVPGKMVPDKGDFSLIGRMPVNEALALLLKGTSLAGEITRDGVLVIKEINDETGGDINQTSTSREKADETSVSHKRTNKSIFKSVITGLAAIMEEGQPVSAQAQVIEEIIVTAQKRAESIMDIGVSVTAFSGDDVRELGFTKPKDIAAHTPGLHAMDSGATGLPIFTIRGVGLDDFNANNASGVAIYFDEVNSVSPLYLKGQLFDLERVEVLKGPQGTLYGKNATGGAINYISSQPTEEFGGYVNVGYSRWDTIVAEGAINGSALDGVNSRLSAYFANGDAYQEDTLTSEEFGETDVFSIRWLTDFEIGDNANLLLNLHYNSDESKPRTSQNLGIDAVIGLPPGTVGVAPTVTDPRDVAATGSVPFERDEEGFGASGKLTIDFEHFTLTSITAYDEYDRSFSENVDGSRLTTIDTEFDDETDTISQELRFSSNRDGAFSWDGRFSWIIGLTYSEYDYKGDNASVVTDLLGPFIGFTPGTTYVPGDRIAIGVDIEQETDSFGAYLHTETQITDQLSLLAGLRYSKDEHSINSRNFSPDGWFPAGFFSPIPFPGTEVFNKVEKQENDNVSFKIGLDFKLNDDWLLFGSVSTGYKAGVYYGLAAVDISAIEYAEPEEVLAYEGGFKGTMLENTLQMNFSAFHYVYDDRQSLVIVFAQAAQTLAPTLQNLSESEMTGAELELRWLVADNLDLRASVAYIDSEITDPTVKLPAGAFLISPIVDGLQLPSSPEWSYSMIATYDWHFDAFSARAQLDYSWIDERTTALGDPNGMMDSLNSLGARLNIGPTGGPWQVAVWGRNLTDGQDATYAGSSTEGGFYEYRQLPRSYGVELRYNF